MVHPFEYHRETKHYYNRYARSPRGMEWETQPDPFRSFAGSPTVNLPFLSSDPEQKVDTLFVGAESPEQITIESIGALPELSMGLSNWKEYHGNRWSLRMNPSSGNLHPTEAYVISSSIEGLDGGVYHYAPFSHMLEQRINAPIPPMDEGFFIGLTSIFWRESWKYGERAFRYCNHDVGHAVAALRFSANLLGWNIHVCPVGDEKQRTLLGIDKTEWIDQEEEHTDILLWVSRSDSRKEPSDSLLELIQPITPLGKPNILSSDHRIWERITEVSESVPRSGILTSPVWNESERKMIGLNMKGSSIIRQRRSAQNTSYLKSKISFEQFLVMIDSLRPRKNVAPFDVSLGESRVHPVFFVHNVESLEQGLYIQVRNSNYLEELKSSLDQSFLWEMVEDDLFCLTKGDVREKAAVLSCGQEICGNGSFAVAMISRFEPELTEDCGRYRELFWEAGMIGQILYLQAEIAGLRGTGIGCYFDDPVHDLLGIKDESYQSIYHFTIGYPLEDSRITSIDPYFHLSEGRTSVS